MHKVPVIVNGRIARYITPYQYKKVSFWERHKRFFDELTLVLLIAAVTWEFLILATN